MKHRAIALRIATIALDRRRGVWRRRRWWRWRWRWRRARVCACVCVRAWLSLDRAREAARIRATHGIACAISAATRVAAVAAVAVACVVVACVRVCVCACVCLGRGREATRDRATHISDCARPQHTRTRLVQRASCAPPRRIAIGAALCGASRHAPLRARRSNGPSTQLWARTCIEFGGSVV